MEKFKIRNRKLLYKDGTPVKLEMGNLEQIEFVKRAYEIGDELKDGLPVVCGEENEVLCKCMEWLDFDEDVDVGDTVICNKCESTYEVVIDEEYGDEVLKTVINY